jgi:hypothetical protein
MHNSWRTHLTNALVTPRKTAWVLVIAGVAYFIYISPKTPTEIFDANVSDEVAIRELNAKKMTDPVAAAGARRMDQLMSCKQRMDRIALLYDLENDPQRVNSARLSIIEGFYSTDESTEATLRANNETYRATEQELDRCRKELQSDERGRAVGEPKEPPTEQKVLEAAVFRMQLEMMLLRQFQASLFLRNAR